jgi:membrane fusion protein, multidrug efflux system
MKRTIITVVVLLVAVGASAVILKGNKEKMQAKTDLARKVNTTVPVQIAEVKTENLAGSFVATGSFSPSKQLVVVNEVAGRIVALPVDAGQFVNKGQLLARLDHIQADAELQAAQASFDKLATDKKRYSNLLNTGGVTQSQLDEVNLQYVNAETRLITAKKKVSDTYIIAPFGGYVNKRFVEEGAYINVGKEVFEVVDISTLKMVVDVTESQVLAVDQSRSIKVNADVYPDVQYKAQVNFIGAKADANLKFPVELLVTNVSKKPLRAGMFGRASFELAEDKPVRVIPRSALVSSVTDASVYLLKGTEVVERKIVVGRQFGDKIEVIDGVAAGDKVVTSGQINLREGMQVSVIN